MWHALGHKDRHVGLEKSELRIRVKEVKIG
jgi:hypothetical protein